MISSFLGGLALFLYGQFLLERSLQKASQIHLRGILKLLTRYRGTAILTGGILAVGMQSSTIPVFTLIGLINRGALQLGQAIGMVLGASIGTTVMAQAITFDITGYALWFIIIGLVIYKIARYSVGELFTGFGFMFFGMHLIASGVALFKATSFGDTFLNGLYASPYQNMIGAFILTLISQSTLAALAVGIILMRGGGLGISCAIPIIFGAHIAAGILPLVYSWKISDTAIGRQLGLTNLLYRIACVVIFIPLMTPLIKFSSLTIQWFGAAPFRQLANAHTIFVLASAAIFSPFIMPYMKFIKRILPEKKKYYETERHLRNNIDKLKQEEIQLAEGVDELLKSSLSLWEEISLKEIYKIERQGYALRSIEDNAWEYAGGSKDISLAPKNENVLKVISNMGDIANVIGNRLVDLTRRKIIQGLNFSIEGLNEVLNIHRHIIDEFNIVLKNLKNKKDFTPLEADPTCRDVAAPIYRGERPPTGSSELKVFDEKIRLLISASYKSHLNRITKGFQESRETRLLHTDAITLLEYVHWDIQKITTNDKIQITNEI